MIAKAKAYVPGSGAYSFECDLSDAANPVKMTDEQNFQAVETSKTAKDCNFSEEGFRLICIAQLASIAGVQCGTWTVQ